MNDLDSISEIRDALEKNDSKTVIIQAAAFWNRSIVENRQDVKYFLVELTNQFENSRYLCIQWLSEFYDPDLSQFFLKYISDSNCASAAIIALSQLGKKGLIAPDDPVFVTPLLKLLLPQERGNNEDILLALISLKAVSALDTTINYLEHPHPAIRVAAIKCVIAFSRLANRSTVLEKVIKFLDDPHPTIRYITASYLKAEYPDRFANLDLTFYEKGMRRET